MLALEGDQGLGLKDASTWAERLQPPESTRHSSRLFRAPRVGLSWVQLSVSLCPAGVGWHAARDSGHFLQQRFLEAGHLRALLEPLRAFLLLRPVMVRQGSKVQMA